MIQVQVQALSKHLHSSTILTVKTVPVTCFLLLPYKFTPGNPHTVQYADDKVIYQKMSLTEKHNYSFH